MKPLQEIINWTIQRHVETNHYYDKFLPYEFHLRLVMTQADEYKELCDIGFDVAKAGCAGHDLIEDTRTTWNDIVEATGSKEVAEIIFAVTNEKGRNRAERANDAYYAGIKKTPGALFVKLCDRLANIKYGVLTHSKMVNMYAKENKNFYEKLYDPRFQKMFDEMDRLLAMYGVELMKENSRQ